ncbi:Origin of replication complex subunit 1B [Vitis vinifera]|uniref:Origin recognition complex subunit 1 n=1 Tax=Vitis vinifera TaxID=29760 RepID=A0A438EM53_VITVI|nr:Origin of replication complex subunit 1B [Vitis vinifera]
MWYIWLDGTLPLFLASQTGLHFVEKYYPLVPKATVSSLDGSIFLCFPGKALVGMAEVEAAIQEMFQAPHIQVMKSSSKLSKIFLVAMVHGLYQTGMVETTFEKLSVTVSCLCTSNGEKFPGWDTLLELGKPC